MRNDALLRVFSVLRELSGGPRTLLQLAQATAVTTRTIRRDLEVLSLSGFMVRGDKFDSAETLWRLGSVGCPVCQRHAKRIDLDRGNGSAV